MYSSDIKLCARQIVKESLNQILANIYQIPTLEEMKSFLKKNIKKKNTSREAGSAPGAAVLKFDPDVVAAFFEVIEIP